MTHAITTPSEQESDHPLRNFKLLNIILEFVRVKDAKFLTQIDNLLRRFVLLRYGFINEDSTGKISYAIDESCFAAAWDFLKHAECNVHLRTAFPESPGWINWGLIRSGFCKKMPMLYLFHFSYTQSGDCQISFDKFDKLMAVLIPDYQLQNSIFQKDVTSNKLLDLLDEMFRKKQARKILKGFLADVDKKTGISSTQCWKSALKCQVVRHDRFVHRFAPAINVFHGIFMLISSLLCIVASMFALASFACSLISATGLIPGYVHWSSLGKNILMLSLSVIVMTVTGLIQMTLKDLLPLRSSHFLDKGQYDRGDQWLRFFHNGIAKQKQEQESRFDTYVINIDADNSKKLR